jgi:putative pyruvate formate lyase activating enzyme
MNNYLEKCHVCPHKCGVNRLNNEIGRCKSTNQIKIALASLHLWEEPCISGNNGSGTVFFTNCNLNCIYCQNHEISQEGKGKYITIEQLSDIFISLQNKKANNINLVTPTTYIPQIIEAIKLAKENGLTIPIVYNSSGYESVDSLKLLDGYIDIYLPDLKYAFNELGEKYSKASNYFDIATNAIKEMYRQVGPIILNDKGILQKGLIIRHLILPNQIENTKKILTWIKDNFNDDIYVSIMSQYFPTHLAKNYPELNRKITEEEYNEIEQYLFDLDIENGYIQELGEHEEEYVPNFGQEA